MDACLKNRYCRLSSHCFNVLLEYSSDTGASDIFPSLCYTIGGDLTAVTQRFISTQLSTARTVKGSSSLHGSCTPWTLRTRVSTSMNCTIPSTKTGISAKHEPISMMGAILWTQLKACNRFPILQANIPTPPSGHLRISWCGNLLLREHPFPANLPTVTTSSRYCVLGI